MPNLLALRIEETIRPVVGIVLAQVSVELEAKRIGSSVETITREDLPRIAESLATQLALVVGEDLAKAAARRVKALI